MQTIFGQDRATLLGGLVPFFISHRKSPSCLRIITTFILHSSLISPHTIPISLLKPPCSGDLFYSSFQIVNHHLAFDQSQPTFSTAYQSQFTTFPAHCFNPDKLTHHSTHDATSTTALEPSRPSFFTSLPSHIARYRRVSQSSDLHFPQSIPDPTFKYPEWESHSTKLSKPWAFPRERHV